MVFEVDIQTIAAETTEALAPWVNRAITIGLIAFGGWFIAFFLRRIIGRYIKKTKGVNQRASTVASLMRSVISYVVYIITAALILENGFDLDLSTLLAGVGIVGVAVGFGAQSLVKDIIAGIFFLVEEQYSVGDSVTIEGFTGIVWELGLRSTTLSNSTGDRFTIPNGSISKVTNHSRLDRSVAVRCDVSYETDLAHAMHVMAEIGAAAYAEEGTLLLATPAISGVTKLGESGITLQMMCRCAAGNQYSLERDMLARVKTGFDAAGIDIPYNRLVVINQDSK